MSYHVHNALKAKVLFAIDKISASSEDTGVYADLNTITAAIGVTKDKVSSALTGYIKHRYIIKKKYRSPVNLCRYYYELLDVGKSVLMKLAGRIENHQTLNLRKDPVFLDGDYIKGKEFDEERERKRKDKLSPIISKFNELFIKAFNTGKDATFEEKQEMDNLHMELTRMLEKAIPINT